MHSVAVIDVIFPSGPKWLPIKHHCHPKARLLLKNSISYLHTHVYTYMHGMMFQDEKHRKPPFKPLDELLCEAIVPLPHPSHPSSENEFICITASIMDLRD